MSRDIIIAFGKRHAVTSTIYGEVQEWHTIQFADLAHYLNTADRIFGHRIEYHLAALAEYGFHAAKQQAHIHDYHAATRLPLTQLLFANNIAHEKLITPADRAAAIAALTQTTITNGVLYLNLEEYVLYPARIALCLT